MTTYLNAVYKSFLALSIILNISLICTPAIVMADAKSQIKSGVNQASGGPATTDPAATLNGTISSIINVLSSVIGVIAVIMIIVAGARYVTSGGNDTSVTAAKKTLLYALIGLVIVALAQVIVKFVINNVI